jgi:hypothetical protein
LKALPIFLFLATAGIGAYFYQNGHIKLPGSSPKPEVATAKNKCPNAQPQVLNLKGGTDGLLATQFNEKNERILPAGTIPATASSVTISFNEATNTSTLQNITCSPLHVLIKLKQATTFPGTVTELKIGFPTEGILNPGETGTIYGKWSLSIN